MSLIRYDRTASHLRPALSIGERKVAVAKAFNTLSGSGLKIDMLVATGISGIVFGTSLADMMNLPLAIVRKQEMPMSCSGKNVEGPDNPYQEISWVFVDDLISSGTTYRRVITAMDQRYTGYHKLVGIMLYKDWFESDYGVRSLVPCGMSNLPPFNTPVFTLEGRKFN